MILLNYNFSKHTCNHFHLLTPTVVYYSLYALILFYVVKACTMFYGSNWPTTPKARWALSWWPFSTPLLTFQLPHFKDNSAYRGTLLKLYLLYSWERIEDSTNPWQRKESAYSYWNLNISNNSLLTIRRKNNNFMKYII